ncbi:MAG: Lrp/AsnC family transcriptional regulator [Candidatus Desantisbacteria bacterium]
MNTKDKEILEILEKDAKIPLAKIALMVALDEKDVESRISNLEKKGIILQYKTIINWEKTDEEKVYAFIEVKVIPERDTGFDTIAKRIYNFPEVHSLYLIAGDYDFAVVVEGKSMKELAYFVAEKLAPLPHIQSTGTHFLLKKYKLDGKIIEEEIQDKRLAMTL